MYRAQLLLIGRLAKVQELRSKTQQGDQRQGGDDQSYFDSLIQFARGPAGEAASVLNMARVDVIRRSLMRDLQYVLSEELTRTRRYKTNQRKRYLEWAALKAKIALLEH